MSDYRQAAIALWGHAGEVIHVAYDQWRQLYPGLPDRVPMVIDLPAYGRCFGSAPAVRRSLPRIGVAPRSFESGEKSVFDAVCHEMLHAWLDVTGQNVKHDSPAWYDTVRRLSPAVLGFDLDVHHSPRRKSIRVENPKYVEGGDIPKTVVRNMPIAGANELHEKVSGWPHTFRPDGYYDDDPAIACPS